MGHDSVLGEAMQDLHGYNPMKDAQGPEHWPTERMIGEGHADYATRENLEALDESLLIDIAKICEVEFAAPDECIPCLAYAMVEDRHKQAEAPFPDPDTEGDPKAPQETPQVPVVERFADEVRTLSRLVDEMLEGPPIPPPNVTLGELALLTVAAQKWVRVTEAQGVELSDRQQQALEATKQLLARLDHG